MSQQSVDLTQRGVEAWNQDDFEWFLDHITADFELRPLPEFFPDLDELYVGKAGWSKFVDVWVGAWESIALQVERIEDLGDDVLVVVTYEGVGRGAEPSPP